MKLLKRLRSPSGLFRHDDKLVADLFDNSLGHDVQLQGDFGPISADRDELNASGVARTVDAPPSDRSICLVIDNLGVPLPAGPGDLGDPVQALVASG